MIPAVGGLQLNVHDVAPDIPGYAIAELLGRGGMGAVYRATQLSLRQPVAIKVLAEAFRSQPSFVARFQREASLQVSLQHPHVVPVLESGEADGIPFIVMRYIDGLSMREMVSARVLTPGAAAELLTGIASALDYAHVRGILHLDVKPHNVLVEGERHAWLADFGLTRVLEESTGLTLTGLVGTFDYLAPEIARGEEASPASDVYSLAVTAFQALTGVLPFPVAHQAAAVFAHASAVRPRASDLRPGLPDALDVVLRRGMAVAPSERQSSAGELIDDVREALGLDRIGGPRLAPVATDGQINTHQPAELPSSAPTAAAASRAESVNTHARLPPHRRRPTRSLSAVAVLATATATAVAVVLAIVLLRSPGPRARLLPAKTYVETVGSVAHNWVDYRLATGPEGPLIQSHKTVRIACRLHGYKVTDGNTWWYRIASQPWGGRYYVSADAFYNNGKTSGPLKGTPFVDPRVPNCYQSA